MFNNQAVPLYAACWRRGKADQAALLPTGRKVLRHNKIINDHTPWYRRSICVSHGLMGSSTNWNAAATALSMQLQDSIDGIVGVDNRNHGRSQHTKDHNSMLIAADLKQLIAESGHPGIPKDTPHDFGDRVHDLEERIRSVLLSDSLRRTADELIKVPRSTILMGHSMGGLATMTGMIRNANAKNPRMGKVLGHRYKETIDRSNVELGLRKEDERTSDFVDVDAFEAHPTPGIFGEDRAGNLDAADPMGTITGCIIVDSVPFTRSPDALYEIEHDLNVLSKMPIDTVIQRLDEASKYLMDKIPNTMMRQFLLTNFVSANPNKGTPARWRCNLELLKNVDRIVFPFKPSDMDVEAVISPEEIADAGGESNISKTVFTEPLVKSDVPVLFVFGEKSPYNTKEGRSLIDEYFSNAEQIEIPGAGHYPHFEKRDAFVEAVSPFARKLMHRHR